MKPERCHKLSCTPDIGIPVINPSFGGEITFHNQLCHGIDLWVIAVALNAKVLNRIPRMPSFTFACAFPIPRRR
jgi:hypothetical protein